jgi:hypothetical protein
VKSVSHFTRSRPVKGGPAVILFPDEGTTKQQRWKRAAGITAVGVVAAAIVWVSWPGSPDYRVPPSGLNAYAAAPAGLRSQSYGGSTSPGRTRTASRAEARATRPTRERERPRSAAAPATPAVAARDTTPAVASAPADTAAAVAAPPGRLMISSMPWGRLFVDGQFIGNTPRVNAPVAAGRRRILITREGYAPFDTVITVLSGTQVRITDITLRSTRQCDTPPCS